MASLDLFTVDVFEIRATDGRENHEGSSHANLFERTKHLKEFQNMRSARIIQGKTLELEHSRLVEPAVKFKTIINYSKSLEEGSTLGLAMIPQQGYINKLEDNPA